MKFFLTALLALLINTDPKEVAKVNSLKKEAESAFLSKDYELALGKYSILRDSLGVDDPAIDLNLAHSYYQLDDTASAKKNYASLTRSADTKLKSIAYQQLGVINKDNGKLEEALQQLKSAIKADPSNQDARYNYEVVKKLLEEQQQQNQNQQNQDQNQENQDQQKGEDENEQQNQDQQNQDQEGENQEEQEGEGQEKSEEEKEQEQEGKEQKEGEEEQKEQSQEQMTKEKLEEMGISEEKARQLLEAMRQSEIKYLQQQRRKPTKRPPSGKPDW
ncbi:MAG: hypothetical protein AAFY41_15045 [Bacteroidota bacterium]